MSEEQLIRLFQEILTMVNPADRLSVSAATSILDSSVGQSAGLWSRRSPVRSRPVTPYGTLAQLVER